MRSILFVFLLACSAATDGDVTDTAATDTDVSAAPASVARIRPADPKQPVADPGAPADDVLADEKIPCIREGGFMKRCPRGESCVYDRAEDGTKGAAYCVNAQGEPTGNVPKFRGLR
jgi:hypothetical protein